MIGHVGVPTEFLADAKTRGVGGWGGQKGFDTKAQSRKGTREKLHGAQRHSNPIAPAARLSSYALLVPFLLCAFVSEALFQKGFSRKDAMETRRKGMCTLRARSADWFDCAFGAEGFLFAPSFHCVFA